MPYKVKGKCVYKKNTGKKVGCTKGPVKKYLAALHANVKDSVDNKISFEDFYLLEKDLAFQRKNEMLLEVSQKYIDKINEYKKELPFNNIFDDKLRIVIPLSGTSTYTELIDELGKIPNFSYLDSDKKEIVRKIKTKTPQGEGEKEQRISLGKAINSLKIDKEKKTKFLNWFSEYGSSLKTMNELSTYSIIISRSPIDILRMSDMGRITSCHSEGNTYFHCAIQEAKTGGPIAYLVKTQDIKQLSEEDLNEQEIFADPDRDLKGIVPLARIRLRRYLLNDGRELAIPEVRKYGESVSGFYDTLKNFIKNKQENIISFDQLQSLYGNRKIVRTGGSYSDSSDSTLFNTMYDVDVFYRDVPREDGDEEDETEARVNQFETELAEFKNNYLKGEHIFADYQVDVNDNYVYYNAWGGINIELDNLKIKKDLVGLLSDSDHEFQQSVIRHLNRSSVNNDYYYKKNPNDYEQLRRLFSRFEENLSIDMSDISSISYNEEKNTLTIFLCIGEECYGTPDNTDDFRYICQTLSRYDKNYDSIKLEVVKSLVSSGFADPTGYDAYSKSEDSNENIFKDIKNLEYDPEEDENYFSLTGRTILDNLETAKTFEQKIADTILFALKNYIDELFKPNKKQDTQLSFKNMFESVTYKDFKGLEVKVRLSTDSFYSNEWGIIDISFILKSIDNDSIDLIYFLDKSASDIINISNLAIAKVINPNDIKDQYDDYLNQMRKLYGKFL